MSSALKVKECRDEKRDAWKHFSENKYLRVSVGARKETEEIYYEGQKGQTLPESATETLEYSPKL